MRNFTIHQNMIFLDIETVPEKSSFTELSEAKQNLWIKKAQTLKIKEDVSIEDFYNQKAAIYSEFGKIITVAIGFFDKKSEYKKMRVGAISSDDEKQLLNQFSTVIKDKFDENKIVFCTHNGKEFDLPYLARRMLIHQIELPFCLDLRGLKPWEINHFDSLDLWKFGDYKHYTSLALLAEIFGLSSSKNDIDGSQVRDVYYLDKDLSRIKKYCIKDVVLTAQVFQRMALQSVVSSENVTILKENIV